MLLALDLGNTSLSGAVFDGKKIVRRFKIPVREFRILKTRLARELKGRVSQIHAAALATVNPPNVYIVEEALNAVLPKVKMTLIGRDVKVPVKALVDRPAQVGADRLLGALAAFRRVKGACLVVDLGTATTVDVVSAKGEFLGGVILSGLSTSALALRQHTALLPQVRAERTARVTGKNTAECIQSGLFWGTVSQIEGLVARLKKEHPAIRKVLATGGDAELIASRCDAIDQVVGDLVLEGIAWTIEGAAQT